MSREQAITACKAGAYTAIISAILTMGFASYAFIQNKTTGYLGTLNDPFTIIEIVVVWLCAYGLFYKSRTAAITIFCLFLLNKIAIYKMTHAGINIISLLFLYYYAKAILGAFSYHKTERINNPNYKNSPKWTFYLGIPIGVLLFGLCILGLVLE